MIPGITAVFHFSHGLHSSSIKIKATLGGALKYLLPPSLTWAQGEYD
jgi:hypothetical protein